MKKRIFKTTIALGVVVASLLFMSCAQQSERVKPDMANEVIAIYHGDNANTITSYQATAKTYYTNNRSAALPELRNEYRLSLKVIDGELFTRIDLDASRSPDQAARAIVTNGSETVVLNNTTNTVEQRLTLPESQRRLALLSDTMQSVGRLNLDTVKVLAQKLSLDMIDSTPGMLQLNVPATALPAMPNNARVQSYKINFDVNESVLVNSEMIIIEENGTTITVTTTPIYQEDGENLIKVGEQTVTAYDIPGVLDVSDSVTAEYATADDIPEISAEELAALQATGEVSGTESTVILGDLSDASYTETQLTLYEQVALNTLADSMFRMDL